MNEYTETQKQRNQRLSNARNRRWRVRKRNALLFALGGKCVDCGVSESEDSEVKLEFDHIDPNQKEFVIGKEIKDKRMPELLREVVKCELRCYDCHKIRTFGEKELPF